jgi:diacylglycerol kinase
MALSGTASLIGFLIRFVALKRELAFHAVQIAFRQSFLFALFIIAILILLSQGLFNWLNLLMLIVVFVITETVMISSSKNR